MTNVMRIGLWLAVSSEAQAREEKISLQEQERVGLEWIAKQPNAKLVKVFRWDGYSRSETDVLTAYDDFAAQGRFEYHELRQMWQRHELDVLWVYVHDRLGRSTALYAQVMVNVIKSGARIFSHMDGWIDENNVDTFLPIGSVAATGDIRKLVKRREMGMRKRLTQGRSTTSAVPETHLRVRDPVTGGETGLVVNEAKRRLFDDTATLVLEGLSWHQIDLELYRRFGHVTDKGKPYSPGRAYHRMMTPMTWGHNALKYRLDRPGSRWAQFGEWLFEPGHEVPEGVIIQYNVIPPVYDGELAERLKAEIRFRMASVRGRTPSSDKYWFSGLVVCDECGYYMRTYAATTRSPRLKCVTRWLQSHSRHECQQQQSVMASYLKDWLTNLIQQIIDTGDFSLLSPTETTATQSPELLRKEVEQSEQEIRGLMREQNRTEGTRYDLLEVEINEQIALLDIRKLRLKELEQASFIEQRTHEDQKQAIERIAKRGFADFWADDAPTIRNELLAVLGGYRLSAREGKIKKRVPAPYTNGR